MFHTLCNDFHIGFCPILPSILNKTNLCAYNTLFTSDFDSLVTLASSAAEKLLLFVMNHLTSLSHISWSRLIFLCSCFNKWHESRNDWQNKLDDKFSQSDLINLFDVLNTQIFYETEQESAKGQREISPLHFRQVQALKNPPRSVRLHTNLWCRACLSRDLQEGTLLPQNLLHPSPIHTNPSSHARSLPHDSLSWTGVWEDADRSQV